MKNMGVTTSTTNAENNSAAAEHQNDTLPVPNSTLSYWREKPHRLDSHRSTPDLPTSCDVAIIGSGLAGVSVAYAPLFLQTTIKLRRPYTFFLHNTQIK